MNFMKLLRTVSKSFMGRTVALANTPQLQLFSATLIYYASLYFSTSNRTFILLTFLYWLVVFQLTKSLKLSLFAGLVATLLFPKGRAFQLLLLPKESIERWVLFDISYFFPIYISDLFLGLLGYLYLRGKRTTENIRLGLQKAKSFWWLFLFVIWVAIGGTVSVIPEVGWLSTLQLVRMMILVGLPLLMFAKQVPQLKKIIWSGSAAVLLFESFWVFAQRALGGPLGKDIEVYLPGAQFGIRASENIGLLRTTGTFFEPSILGTFLLLQMVILLTLVLGKKKSHQPLKIVALIAIGAGSLALVFTGSRILYGVWLLLALLVWRYWQTSIKAFMAKIPTKILTASAIIAIIIVASLAPYLARRIETLSDVFTQYGSATYRLEMMEYATRLAVESPLLGVGINLSPYYFASGFEGETFVFDPTYPHNLLFQLLAETGLIGAILFILFGFFAIRPFLLGLKTGIIKEYSLAAGVYLLCAMFYPIFLNHPELSSYFFLYVGLSVLNESRKINVKK
jgi:O-antigen ligase